MYKKYLVSYNDDNHYTNYWFDGDFIGTSENIMDLMETMFGYGIDEGEYSNTIFETLEISIFDIPEKLTDEVHNYLSKGRAFNQKQWKYLIQKDYKNFINMCINS